MIEFNEENHSYKVNGVWHPSVTQIISDGIPPAGEEWFTEESRDRGKAVHKACQLINQGKLLRDSVHPTIESYINAYEKFLSDTGIEVIGSEIRLYHPIYRYCGTLDMVGRIAGNNYLIDIKSGGVPLTVSLQLNAYRMAFEELSRDINFKFDHIRTLQLKNDGKYKLITHEINDDFLIVLNFYNLKQKIRG